MGEELVIEYEQEKLRKLELYEYASRIKGVSKESDALGNKMLLYGDDNTSAGNNNYSTKQGTYRTGKRGQNQGTLVDTFQLVKDLLANYPGKFNHEEVVNRAKELAKFAVNLW